MASILDRREQIGALLLLDFVRDQVTNADQETYTRGELLVLLTSVMDDPVLIDPDVREVYDEGASQAEAFLREAGL